MTEPEWKLVTSVREGEFEIADDGVLHVLTGAMFWANPDEAKAYKIDWGKANDTDEDDNPLYDTGGIALVAEELLKQRLG